MAKQDKCGDCLYWEHRAEVELDDHTGYCSQWEMLKRDTQVCPKFRRRTPESEQKYLNQLYNDGSHNGDDDGDGEGGGGPFPDTGF